MIRVLGRVGNPKIRVFGWCINDQTQEVDFGGFYDGKRQKGRKNGAGEMSSIMSPEVLICGDIVFGGLR